MKPLQAGGWTRKSLHPLEPTGHLLKKGPRHLHTRYPNKFVRSHRFFPKAA